MEQLVVLPLPDRIPRPSGEILDAFNVCGILLLLEENTEADFVDYKLPKGWTMIDKSTNEGQPNFHIVDQDSCVRFTITGVWTGLPGSELHLTKVNDLHATPSRISHKPRSPLQREVKRSFDYSAL
jgi:hypothetical protein